MSYRDYDPLRKLSEVHPHNASGGVNPTLEDSVTFAHDPSAIEGGFRGEGGEDFDVYGRLSHPSLRYLGRQFNAIEDAGLSICVSSGQACSALVLSSLLRRGDHVVASNRLYGGTASLLDELPTLFGVWVTRVDVTNFEEVERALKQKHTKLLLVETVSNPSLVASNIPALAELAHRRGAYLCVDNTFMPLVVQPLRLGADLTYHSLTKFGSGQSDVMGGVVCVGRALVAEDGEVQKRMKSYLGLFGPVMYHGVAHEISKRLPHLWIRFREASGCAKSVAEMFRNYGFVVHYPSLSGYPHVEAIRNIMRTDELGYGAVLAVDFKSSDVAMQFARNLEAAQGGLSAVSLGSAHTYVCVPFASVHFAMHDKDVSGITNYQVPPELTEGLTRIACGYNIPPEEFCRKIAAAIPSKIR